MMGSIRLVWLIREQLLCGINWSNESVFVSAPDPGSACTPMGHVWKVWSRNL